MRGKHRERSWLISKILIMRKQLLLTCLLCARPNAGPSRWLINLHNTHGVG